MERCSFLGHAQIVGNTFLITRRDMMYEYEEDYEPTEEEMEEMK